MACKSKSAYLYSCNVGGVPVASHLVSCETMGNDQKLSEALEKEVHAHAQSQAGQSGVVTCDYVQPVSVSKTIPDEVWMSKRMASNCGPDFNPNNARIVNSFECRYLGEGVLDDGRVVRNPFKVWSGRLVSCEETSLEVSDDLMRDVRHYAYVAAGGDESQLDESQFVCNVMSIPTQ